MGAKQKSCVYNIGQSILDCIYVNTPSEQTRGAQMQKPLNAISVKKKIMLFFKCALHVLYVYQIACVQSRALSRVLPRAAQCPALIQLQTPLQRLLVAPPQRLPLTPQDLPPASFQRISPELTAVVTMALVCVWLVRMTRGLPWIFLGGAVPFCSDRPGTPPPGHQARGAQQRM